MKDIFICGSISEDRATTGTFCPDCIPEDLAKNLGEFWVDTWRLGDGGFTSVPVCQVCNRLIHVGPLEREVVMDPDACLEEALALAGKIVDHDEEDMTNDEMHDAALELAQYVLSLHDWIRGGGFLPKEWRKK